MRRAPGRVPVTDHKAEAVITQDHSAAHLSWTIQDGPADSRTIVTILGLCWSHGTRIRTFPGPGPGDPGSRRELLPGLRPMPPRSHVRQRHQQTSLGKRPRHDGASSDSPATDSAADPFWLNNPQLEAPAEPAQDGSCAASHGHVAASTLLGPGPLQCASIRVQRALHP